MSSETVEQSVESVIKGGAGVIQLREKSLSSRELFELAKRVKSVTDSYNVPLIINDRLDIALSVDAAGVHLGQSDLPCREARRILGNDKIIGVTAPSVKLAQTAQADGADYIGVGAMFASSTKPNVKVNTIDNLLAIRKAVDIPIAAIGGIKRSNVLALKGTAINAAAVISDIISDKKPEQAAKQMCELLTRL